MARANCYSPQLRSEVVSRLYHRAKAERIPMTVLANRLLECALALPKARGFAAATEKTNDTIG